jgi:hypothetical protein
LLSRAAKALTTARSAVTNFELFIDEQVKGGWGVGLDRQPQPQQLNQPNQNQNQKQQSSLSAASVTTTPTTTEEFMANMTRLRLLWKSDAFAAILVMQESKSGVGGWLQDADMLTDLYQQLLAFSTHVDRLALIIRHHRFQDADRLSASLQLMAEQLAGTYCLRYSLIFYIFWFMYNSGECTFMLTRTGCRPRCSWWQATGRCSSIFSFILFRSMLCCVFSPAAYILYLPQSLPLPPPPLSLTSS